MFPFIFGIYFLLLQEAFKRELDMYTEFIVFTNK